NTQEQNIATAWSLFPNPATEVVRLQTKDATLATQTWTVAIRDMHAKVVQEVVLPAGDTDRQIDLSPKLIKGTYQMDIIHKGELLWTTTIVKQ
ncbi:MAG: T9SS type A sorting domain-containing protein, partial [Bacteroidota bacterium]